MSVKHLEGLDGLRFISISFVVLHHLFTFKTNYGYTQYQFPVIGLIGYYGIQFFFTGSGFLITYLLLLEQKAYGRIRLSFFYLRRILRIWPGYYLLICLALFILIQLPFFSIPGHTDTYLSGNYRESNRFFLFFLPHLQPFFYPTAPLVHQTYTIGIEEQFYFIWGLLFVFFRRWLRTIFIVIVVASFMLTLLHYSLFTYGTAVKANYPFLRTVQSAITFIQYSRFSTFAIGSLFAIAYFQKQQWIFYFKKPFVQALLYAGIVLSVLLNVPLRFGRDEWISVLMAALMLSATFSKQSLIPFHSKWISALGAISYGIYLFHVVAIVLAIRITQAVFGAKQNAPILLLLIALTMFFSIGFGWVSYHFYEKHFLRLKRFVQRIR